jgi:hypothetical protein
MSDDTTAVFVTIAEERLQLILPGEGWTFEEAKLAKNVSEGMAPVAIEEGLQLADPDAWLAVLRVSYLRAGKDFPAGAIQNEDILQLMQSVLSAVRKAVKGRPPTSPNENGSPEPEAKPEHEPAAAQS